MSVEPAVKHRWTKEPCANKGNFDKRSRHSLEVFSARSEQCYDVMQSMERLERHSTRAEGQIKAFRKRPSQASEPPLAFTIA